MILVFRLFQEWAVLWHRALPLGRRPSDSNAIDFQNMVPETETNQSKTTISLRETNEDITETSKGHLHKTFSVQQSHEGNQLLNVFERVLAMETT